MRIEEFFVKLYGNMKNDFEKSEQFNHNGNLGNNRENILKKFLEEKLPPKFGIGKGEIASPYFGHSKQCDVIIYDREKSPLLFQNEDNIFLIEGVYGIIEVKSKLSKEKLLEGLENIKAFKKMVSENTINETLGSGITSKYRASKPFGIIFAYDIDKNSLNSLKRNYLEWKKNENDSVLPNLIVVLNKGLIYHRNKLEKYIKTEEIIENNYSVEYFEYKEKTLFQFFVLLYDLLFEMRLGNIRLKSYINESVRIENFYVKGLPIDREKNTIVKYNTEFLSHIEHYSRKTKYSDILFKLFGNIPIGFKVQDFEYEVYFYDPENKLTEIEIDFNCLEVSQMIMRLEINGREYLILSDYMTKSENLIFDK